jgi:hypothetical protein
MRRTYRKPTSQSVQLRKSTCGRRYAKWRAENQEQIEEALKARPCLGARTEKGTLKKGLHRVRFNIPDDDFALLEEFWTFINIERPFAGGFTYLMSELNHPHRHTYAFVDPSDAFLVMLKFRGKGAVFQGQK